jgi:hypothetical protein
LTWIWQWPNNPKSMLIWMKKVVVVEFIEIVCIFLGGFVFIDLGSWLNDSQMLENWLPKVSDFVSTDLGTSGGRKIAAAHFWESILQLCCAFWELSK